jgi:hypothetical protein
MTTTDLKTRMIHYAREKKDRHDVYIAIVDMLRNWEFYSSDDEREVAFARIRHQVIGDARFEVDNVHAPQFDSTHGAYLRERKRQDPVMSAYKKERNKLL